MDQEKLEVITGEGGNLWRVFEKRGQKEEGQGKKEYYIITNDEEKIRKKVFDTKRGRL